MTTEQLSIFESNVLDTINNGYKPIELQEKLEYILKKYLTK
jgi:hypothetical protein